MANERNRRTDPVLQSALDKARQNSDRTASERARFDAANKFPRVLSILAGPAASAAGGVIGGIAGGMPGAAAGAGAGGAAGSALAALIQMMLEGQSQGLRRQEAEQAGQSQVVQSLLR